MKGHRDDDVEATLDRWALLNIQMDEEAKVHWLRIKGQKAQHERVFGEPWPLWIAGKKVSTSIGNEIDEVTKGSRISTHWDERGRFGAGSVSDVAWHSVERR